LAGCALPGGGTHRTGHSSEHPPQHLEEHLAAGISRVALSVCAGLFAGAGATALKMAPKNPALGLVAAGCAVGSVASLSVLGLSSEARGRLSKRDKEYEAAWAGTAAAVPVPPRPARSGARGRG
jgi:hypothetical protein